MIRLLIVGDEREGFVEVGWMLDVDGADRTISQSVNHFVEEWMLTYVDVQDGESACDLYSFTLSAWL